MLELLTLCAFAVQSHSKLKQARKYY